MNLKRNRIILLAILALLFPIVIFSHLLGQTLSMALLIADLVIYLDVDIETSLRRMRKRQQSTDTSADIHEKDVAYLSRCLETAGYACEHFGWQRIDYMKNGAEREVDEKNDEIYDLVLSYLGR